MPRWRSFSLWTDQLEMVHGRDMGKSTFLNKPKRSSIPSWWSVPRVFGIGRDSKVQRPLARVISGGIGSPAFLALVRSSHLWLEREKTW